MQSLFADLSERCGSSNRPPHFKETFAFFFLLVCCHMKLKSHLHTLAKKCENAWKEFLAFMHKFSSVASDQCIPSSFLKPAAYVNV